MKIKQLLVQIILSLLVLIAVKNLIGGFVFSKSTTYVFIFLALVAFSGWITNRIQVFFLLPKIIPFMILIHTAVLFGVFYVCNYLLGGITITKFLPSFVLLFDNHKSLQSIGEFGTIGIVAFVTGAALQIISWLNSEK